jgi:hypothetical protein
MVGYNSSRFDLPALVQHWPSIFDLDGSDLYKTEQKDFQELNNVHIHLPGSGALNKNYLLHLCAEDRVMHSPSVIQPGNKYVHIITPHGLLFRDLVLFVSPGTSLSRLGVSYDVDLSKMTFPYGILRNDFDLDAETPEPSARCYDWFENSLKKPWHRVSGHLLEGEWAERTRQFQLNHLKQHVKVQPVPELWNPFEDNPFDLNQTQLDSQWENVSAHMNNFIGPIYLSVECLKLTPGDGYDDECPYARSEWHGRVRDIWEWTQDCLRKSNTKHFYDKVPLPVKPPKSVAVGIEIPQELHSLVQEYLRDPNLDKQKAWEYEDAHELSKEKLVTGVGNFKELFLDEYKQRGCQNMGEYLKAYNNVDVEIMHPIITKMRSKWKTLDPLLMLFRNSMSLPNLSRNFGFKEAEKAGASFHLCKGPEQGEKWERTMRRNVVGGPSIIYNRRLVVGETRLKNGAKVKNIFTYDGNSLYPFSLLQAMPTGPVVYMYHPDEITGKWSMTEVGKTQDSIGEKVWMNRCQEKLTGERSIRTKTSAGTSVRKGPYLVDGYRAKRALTSEEQAFGLTEVAYEYCGDFWHGHPELISEKMNAATPDLTTARTLQERLCKTLLKFVHLIQSGCAVFWAWEREFKGSLSMNWKSYLSHYPRFTREYQRCDVTGRGKEGKEMIMFQLSDPETFTENLLSGYYAVDEALQMGLDHESLFFFGFVEVDIDPPADTSHLDAFEPLFVKGVREGKTSLYPALSEVNKTLISTPYLRLLLALGYTLRKVHMAVEYFPMKCFEAFVNKVVALRRQGDSGEGDPLLTEVAKLVANSFYGSSLLNKDKHGKVYFVNQWFHVCKAINQRTFMHADQQGEDLFQITACSRKVVQNVPIQVGKMVLDLAKWHMCHFYYSILKHYLRKGSFALGSMDTDSFTIAITENTLDECVEPELLKEWQEEVKPVWFANCAKDCTHASCSKRQPGPFKKEFEGSDFVGLSSKMYTVRGTNPGDKCKVASKGIGKLAMPRDPSRLFLKTLPEGGEVPMVVNYRSLIMHNTPLEAARGVKRVMTQQNNTRTVTSKYSKRAVQRDGSTRPVRTMVDCGTPEKVRQVRLARRQITTQKQQERNKRNSVSRALLTE